MEQKGSIQIVMTPVRNEAWVLRAFLTATSQWADYIIIADQMSTDGSREIYADFQTIGDRRQATGERACELIVIDNKNPEFNEAERQAMLVAKAREVANGRDTLLWGLDADEILPANWQDTEDGKHILNSIPGDVFWFRWAQLAPDKKHYGESVYYPWLFHDDGKEPHGNYVRNMHSMRIPYPIEEKQIYYVKDFRVLHCGLLDPNRIAAKNRFYQFVDWEMNKRPFVTLAGAYAAHRKENQINDVQYNLEPEAMAFPFEFWGMIDMDATHTWFDDYVYERLNRYPMKQLRKLDIWDEDFLKYYGIKDERRGQDKLIHRYLHLIGHKSNLLIRAINKILKKIY